MYRIFPILSQLSVNAQLLDVFWSNVSFLSLPLSNVNLRFLGLI